MSHFTYLFIQLDWAAEILRWGSVWNDSQKKNKKKNVFASIHLFPIVN